MTRTPIEPVVVRRESAIGICVADDRVECEPAQKGGDGEPRFEPGAPHLWVCAGLVQDRDGVLNICPVFVPLVCLLGKRLRHEHGKPGAVSIGFVQVPFRSRTVFRASARLGFRPVYTGPDIVSLRRDRRTREQTQCAQPARRLRERDRPRPSLSERTCPESCSSDSDWENRKTSGHERQEAGLRGRPHSGGTAAFPRRFATNSADWNCLSVAGRYC